MSDPAPAPGDLAIEELVEMGLLRDLGRLAWLSGEPVCLRFPGGSTVTVRPAGKKPPKSSKERTKPNIE